MSRAIREKPDYDPNGPYAAYGDWHGWPNTLFANWGTSTGTVPVDVRVPAPGTYAVWVLSNPVNLSYAAPWNGRAIADGRVQFTYKHRGKIPSVWMKMGDVTVTRPGNVRIEFILDGAGSGDTYRRIHTLFLVDSQHIKPKGTVRPPWTMAMYENRAEIAGALPTDKLLVWVADSAYRRLSQEVWADGVTQGASWPNVTVNGTVRTKNLLMARETCRAVSVGLRNLTGTPIPLQVEPGPLEGGGKSFPDAITWRVPAFIPYGPDRQKWTPFFLMRRPNVTVPPRNVAGVWLTVNTHGVPAGSYKSRVRFSGPGVREHTVVLNVRVAAVTPNPKRPVLVDGYTNPHEGDAYRRDFVEHGMNVWSGPMSKAEMEKWGICLLHLQYTSTEGLVDRIARLKELGLDYNDYFVAVNDEPSGTTAEALKGHIDLAKAIKDADPNVRISFNPSESAELPTFEVLAPYCNFWLPYTKHVFSPHWNNPQKKAIYHPKPWMWYTTPCLWDKTSGDPGIRQAPSRSGNCVGVAFFALNYPWRDQWDTAYEHFPDASTMGAVMSRHGPVATIIWEQIREASQTANLAMMVRERLGATTFDDVTDPGMQELIRSGADEALIKWLEEHQ